MKSGNVKPTTDQNAPATTTNKRKRYDEIPLGAYCTHPHMKLSNVDGRLYYNCHTCGLEYDERTGD